jgi:hypothetical protein
MQEIKVETQKVMIIVECLIKRNAYLSWPRRDDLPLDSILLLGLFQLVLVVRRHLVRSQHDLQDVLTRPHTAQHLHFRTEPICICAIDCLLIALNDPLHFLIIQPAQQILRVCSKLVLFLFFLQIRNLQQAP